MADEPTPSPAFRDGWHAHRLGAGVDSNPYNEITQSFSHSEWSGGWCLRFGAVKHSQDLSFDDDEPEAVQLRM